MNVCINFRTYSYSMDGRTVRASWHCWVLTCGLSNRRVRTHSEHMWPTDFRWRYKGNRGAACPSRNSAGSLSFLTAYKNKSTWVADLNVSYKIQTYRKTCKRKRFWPCRERCSVNKSTISRKKNVKSTSVALKSCTPLQILKLTNGKCRSRKTHVSICLVNGLARVHTIETMKTQKKE